MYVEYLQRFMDNDMCMACSAGTQSHHAYVRMVAVAYIREHREEFEMFLGEDFGAWVSTMERNRVWGDELTLVGVVLRVETDHSVQLLPTFFMNKLLG
jgi:hypothetical protein